MCLLFYLKAGEKKTAGQIMSIHWASWQMAAQLRQGQKTRGLKLDMGCQVGRSDPRSYTLHPPVHGNGKLNLEVVLGPSEALW